MSRWPRPSTVGETQETADFFYGYAAELERNQAYDRPLPDDPLPGQRAWCRGIRSACRVVLLLGGGI